MQTSLLLLTALSIVLLLQASRHTHASELSQLLDKEIRDLKDEIEKRGKQRKPCGFTWFCRRRRRGRGKRVSEISIYLPNVQVGRSSAFIPCYKKYSQSGYRNTFGYSTELRPPFPSCTTRMSHWLCWPGCIFYGMAFVIYHWTPHWSLVFPWHIVNSSDS